MKISKNYAIELGREAFNYYYENCLKLDVCAKSINPNVSIKDTLQAERDANNYLRSRAGMDSFINASIEFCTISGKSDISKFDILSFFAQKGTTASFIVRVRT